MHVFLDFTTLLPISSDLPRIAVVDYSVRKLCTHFFGPTHPPVRGFLEAHTTPIKGHYGCFLGQLYYHGCVESKLLLSGCWSKARLSSINAHLPTIDTMDILKHPNITRSQLSRTRTEPTSSRVPGETVEPVMGLRIFAASERERDSNAIDPFQPN